MVERSYARLESLYTFSRVAKVPDFGGETREFESRYDLVEDHLLPVNKLVALQAC